MNFLPPPLQQFSSSGHKGLGSVHPRLFLLLLPPRWEHSSRYPPAAARGASHSQQSSTNFHNSSACCGLQFFVNLSNAGQSSQRAASAVSDGISLGHGQHWILPGASWLWLCGTWGRLLAVSHRRHPCHPLTTKIWLHSTVEKEHTSLPKRRGAKGITCE